MKSKWSGYFEDSQSLKSLLQYKAELQAIWDNNSQSVDEMIAAFKVWCNKAEASGNQMLQDFAVSLRQYKLQAFAAR